VAISASTHKGYTGHEQLDNLNLVHMNGRVYDPLIARFLSADPIIQDPYHSQSFNRYSYIWNNPLNGTDPTGFFACTGSHISSSENGNCPAGSWSSEESKVKQNGQGQGAAPTQPTRTDATVNTAETLAGKPSGTPGAPGSAPVDQSQAGQGQGYFCIGISRQCGGESFWRDNLLGEILSSVFGDPIARFNDGVNPISGVWLTPREQFDATGLAAVTAIVPEIKIGSGLLSAIAERLGVQANRIAGKAAETFLRRTYGGGPASLSTSRGWRHLDNLADGVAQESKVGRTALTERVKQQIAKDTELLQSGAVDKVEWHFFEGKTGKGPTEPLRERLQSCGISVCVSP
jgi:RHS repeat-associated protein